VTHEKYFARKITQYLQKRAKLFIKNEYKIIKFEKLFVCLSFKINLNQE